MNGAHVWLHLRAPTIFHRSKVQGVGAEESNRSDEKSLIMLVLERANA